MDCLVLYVSFATFREKIDWLDWDWRMRLNNTPNAIGCIVYNTFMYAAMVLASCWKWRRFVWRVYFWKPSVERAMLANAKASASSHSRSLLQCVAVLQHVAVCCCLLQCARLQTQLPQLVVFCDAPFFLLQILIHIPVAPQKFVAICCRVAAHCSVLQRVAACCSVHVCTCNSLS